MKGNLKRIIAGTAAAAIVLTLSACGTARSGPVQTELSDAPVTIRMTWWGGDARHERTQQVIDLFEKAHPNITVEPEFSDWNGYWEKLATSTAGKNSPDVMQMDQLYLASYASRGTLVDLSKYDVGTTGMEDSVLGMGRWDGGQYAIPISTTTMAFFVNNDLLDQVGVPLPDDTDSWTWDEYDAWTKQVTEAAPQGAFGGAILQNEFALQLYVRQHGGNLFEGNKVTADPKVVEGFFQQALDQSKNGVAAPASVWSENASLALDQNPFSVGKLASMPSPSTMISAYSASTGADIRLVPMPNDADGTEKYDYFKPGMYWTASSQSKHPAEAAALIDFFLNDPEAVKILGTERGIPASATTIDAIRDELTPAELKAVEYAESRVPFLGNAPEIVPNGASDIESVMVRYLQEVLFERQSPADAATALLAELQKSIDAAN